MTTGLPSDGDPRANLATDLGRVMVPALGWSSEITVRFGHLGGVVPTLAAALGCTALTLGSAAIVARRFRTAPAGFEAVVVGALLSSGPIAVVGAVIGAETHHRALGGVTFAFVAAALSAIGFLVVRRALAVLPRGSRRSRVVPPALTILVVMSMGIAFLPLLREFRAASSETGRFIVEDLVVGACLVAFVVLRRGGTSHARAARVSFLAWVLSVAVGAGVLVASMPLRAMLATHAPVALGPLGLGLGTAAAGPVPGIPPAVDVSLH